MTDFFSRLDPNIRDVVKSLRDYGFSTLSCCGHYPDPHIKIDWCRGWGSAMDELDDFLQMNGYCCYRIESCLLRTKQNCVSRHIVLRFIVPVRDKGKVGLVDIGNYKDVF